MNNWQPIETAPKTERILCWSSDECVICYWSDRYSEWWDDEGWEKHPTHWQPLPEGPKVEVK